MKLFETILNDNGNLYKRWIPAKTKKAAMDEARGNGEIEKMVDVTKDYGIALDKLENDLRLAQWGQGERELIVALVREHVEKNVKG